MAKDEILDIEEDAEETRKQQKPKFLDTFLKVLKYFLFILLLGIFVVVVTIITMNTLRKQERLTNTAGPIAINTEQTVPEDLDWFTQIGEIRGSLKDEVRKTFIVDIHIGYEPADVIALQELNRRRVQIRERISLYFSSHYSDDLEGAQNFIRIKNELREIINRTMNNKIREVAFNSFQIISF